MAAGGKALAGISFAADQAGTYCFVAVPNGYAPSRWTSTSCSYKRTAGLTVRLTAISVFVAFAMSMRRRRRGSSLVE